MNQDDKFALTQYFDSLPPDYLWGESETEDLKQHFKIAKFHFWMIARAWSAYWEQEPDTLADLVERKMLSQHTYDLIHALVKIKVCEWEMLRLGEPVILKLKGFPFSSAREFFEANLVIELCEEWAEMKVSRRHSRKERMNLFRSALIKPNEPLPKNYLLSKTCQEWPAIVHSELREAGKKNRTLFNAVKAYDEAQSEAMSQALTRERRRGKERHSWVWVNGNKHPGQPNAGSYRQSP